MPAGFIIQGHALDIQAIAGFTDFDGAVVGFAMQPGVDGIVAIAPGFGAPAADFRFDQGEQAARVRVNTTNDRGAHRGKIAGGQPVRKTLGQTAQDQVVNPDEVLEIETFGGRWQCIEQRAGAGQHPERAKSAAIGNALGGGQGLECHLCGNDGAVATKIGWPLALIGVVAQIDDHFAGADVDPDLEQAAVILQFFQT